MVNSITFDIDNYGLTEDLMKDVSTTLRILTNNDYVCVFKYDDMGIYSLQFAHSNQELGEEYPRWMTAEDFENYEFFKSSDDEGEECTACGDCCNDTIYG